MLIVDDESIKDFDELIPDISKTSSRREDREGNKAELQPLKTINTIFLSGP
jgi:hypothetical protein